MIKLTRMAVFTKQKITRVGKEVVKLGLSQRWECNTVLGAGDTDTIISEDKAGKVPAFKVLLSI